MPTPRPASYGSRVAASIGDGLVTVAIIVAFAGLGYLAGGEGAANTAVLLASLAVGFLYAPLLLVLNNGQTWGKQMAGVRVVPRDGGPLGFGRALAREWTKIVFNIFVVPVVIDVLWPLRDRRNRALHDLVAGTLPLDADG